MVRSRSIADAVKNSRGADVQTSLSSSDVGADFDHRDQESAQCPFDRWTRLRNTEGLAHSSKYGGFYVASKYEDVCRIAHDQKSFSSHTNQVSIPVLVTPPLPPIHFDPPEHRNYRVIVNPYFSPSKVREYEPWIRDLAADFVRPLLTRDSFDVSQDLGLPFTRAVTLRIMGIQEAPHDVNEWSDDVIFQSANAASSGAKLIAFLADEIAQRRINPGTDVLTGLVQARYEDRALTDDEIVNTALLLLLAGLDTTNSAISGAVWYLVQHSESLRKLSTADETIWRLALDEFVRWTTPAPAQSRTAKVDVEVAGTRIPAGDMVMMLYGSANRDEAEFPNADEVVLDRRPNRHVAFGIGPHRCLGMHLAKLDLQCVLQELIPGLADFRVADPDQVIWFSGENRGIKRLPLVRK
jgi:cytochrome P450